MDKRDLYYKEFEYLDVYAAGGKKVERIEKRLGCKCGGVIEVKNNAAKRQHEKTVMHQKFINKNKPKKEYI